MKRTFKSTVSIVIAFAMLCVAFPTGALAAEGDASTLVQSGTITAFENGGNLGAIDVALGTTEAEAIAQFPETVSATVTLDGDETATPATTGGETSVDIPVSDWSIVTEAYDANREYIFVYQANLDLPDGLTLPENVERPMIGVNVGGVVVEAKTTTVFDGDADALGFNGAALTHSSKQSELNALRASDANMPDGSTTTWNIISGTLYLNNFQYTTSNKYALEVSGPATINASGSNTLTSTYNDSSATYGIAYTSGLTIKGDGSLEVTGGTTTASVNSCGIYTAVGGGNLLSVEGSVSLTARGGSAGGASYGIYLGSGNLEVKDSASVEAIGGAASSGGGSRGIQLNSGSAVLNMTSSGSITATANTTGGGTYNCGIFISSNIEPVGVTAKGGASGETNTLTWDTTGKKTYVYSGTGAAHVVITYGVIYDYTIYVNATGINKNSSGNPVTVPGVTYASGTLTLDSVNFETSAETALIMEDGGTITVNGTNTLKTTYSGSADETYGIATGNDLIINGSGALTVTSGKTTSSSYDALTAGIAVDGNLTISDSPTITSTSGDATGNDGISSGVDVYGNFTMAGGTLNATGGNATGSYGWSSGIFVADDFIMTNGTIVTEGKDSAMDVYGNVPSSGVTIKANDGYSTDAQFADDGEGGFVIALFNDLIAKKAKLTAGGTPPPPSPPTPSGGSGKGSSKQDGTTTTQANPWLDPAPAQTKAGEADRTQSDIVRTKSTGTYGVRKDAWKNLKGHIFSHDTIEGNAVQVRVTIDNPAAMKDDALVSAYVKGNAVENRKALFEKWYNNQIRVVHMDETKPWGQNVRIAAKVDLANMDTQKLYFYSYDKKTNKYTRITDPGYRIDKKGYLHFTTPFAGDIIISENPLEKK